MRESIGNILLGNVGRLNDILYPSSCVICGENVSKNDFVCIKCKNRVSFVEEPRCMKCGKMVDSDEKEYCHDCECGKHIYECGIPTYTYNEALKKAIYDFKYFGVRKNAEYFAEEIVNKNGRRIMSWGADVLIPVPLHKKKMRIRGYNQAELLARELSRRLGIRVNSDMLIRLKNTVPQKEMVHGDRKRNLDNAFSIGKMDKSIKKAIIVDDIYTTGSTIDECAKTLINSGVKQVYYISICIGTGI